MARFRTIENTFWSDSKIVDKFTPDDRYMFLYLLTNPQTNQLGCYELSISKICYDTSFGKTKAMRILSKLENELKVIAYDFETNEVFIRNWYKYNWLNSEKTMKCIDKEFKLVKSEKLKGVISPLFEKYMPHARKNKNKNKNKNSNNNKNKNKNKNKNSNNNKNKNIGEKETKKENTPSSDFVAPTLADIISYAEKLKVYDHDYCERFFNHYTAIDWVNGAGNKISNWKLVFNNWIKKDKTRVQEKTSPQKSKLDTVFDKFMENDNE